MNMLKYEDKNVCTALVYHMHVNHWKTCIVLSTQN